jgi:hypothetical protein
MSKPCSSGSVREEIMSAISSLNMEPEPIEGVDSTFLADTDVWAKHAAQHLYAALNLLGIAQAPKPHSGTRVVCIGASEKDVRAALDIVMQALSSINEAEEHEGEHTCYKGTFKAIHAHLMRALL